MTIMWRTKPCTPTMTQAEALKQLRRAQQKKTGRFTGSIRRQVNGYTKNDT